MPEDRMGPYEQVSQKVNIPKQEFTVIIREPFKPIRTVQLRAAKAAHAAICALYPDESKSVHAFDLLLDQLGLGDPLDHGVTRFTWEDPDGETEILVVFRYFALL